MLNTLNRVCTWERSGEISRLIKQSAWPQECCVSHLISVFLNWAEFSHRHWPPPPTGGPPLVGPLLSKRRFPASRGQAYRTMRPSFLVWENSRTNSWRLDANNLFQRRGRQYRGLEKTSCDDTMQSAAGASGLSFKAPCTHQIVHSGRLSLTKETVGREVLCCSGTAEEFGLLLFQRWLSGESITEIWMNGKCRF